MDYILGKKIKMSQLFGEDGKVTPVTLVKAGPCYVTQVKTKEKDGYDAVQIGFEKLKESRIKKSIQSKPYRYLKEKRGKDDKLKVGQEVDVSIFEAGDKVAVSGVSKGKGFAGAVKRWGFVEKAKAHGAKDMRRLGSTGSRFPQRTIKGKKMAGRMGAEKVTVKNLQVMAVDMENDVLAVKGAVPGNRGGLLEIRKIEA